MGVSISTTGGKTHDKIATQRLTSNTSSVTFSNIPQGYTDLYISLHVKNTGGAGYIVSWGGLQFNGNTTQSAYSATTMFSTSTNANASYQETQTGQLSMNVFRTDNNYYGTSFLHINNYSSNVMNKTVLGLSGGTTYFIMPSVGLWSVLDPVTSITFVPEGGTNFASGSVFTVYGIKAALSPKATGGDKVYTTGTHWVHEFYNSGLFVPRVALTADYLVVAGGGGGGGTPADAAGGGGAGGLRSTVTATGGGGSLESSLSLTGSIGYTVIVGGGGAGGISGNANDGISGINGSNSSISGSNITTITSTGGGGGARGTNDLTAGGNTGGSGGGGSARSGSSGSGTANQGYAGGSGGSTSSGAGGGGGGAGAVGENGSGGNGGNGGTGVSIAITGVSKFYAGGGGGGCSNSGGSTSGTGGSGGGGGGNSASSNGVAATSNTGGGGGAAARNSGGGQRSGGNGGSGIVIVRYPV